MATAYQTPTSTCAKRIDIENYASQLALSHGVTTFTEGQSDPLFKFVKQLGGEINYDNPEDVSLTHEDGSIVVDAPCSFKIYLSQYTGVLRDRFTVAHELGHYFLHSRQGAISLKASRKGDGICEWEANWFAASMLMPKEEIEEFCKNNGNSPFAVAARFNVSTMAAEYRLKYLRLE